MTIENSPVNPFEEDLKRILDEEHKKQVNNRTKLLVSWMALMAMLALVFSGLEVDLGFIQINFIKLNTMGNPIFYCRNNISPRWAYAST